MKKLLLIAMALLFLSSMVIVGCGSDDKADAENTMEKTTEDVKDAAEEVAEDLKEAGEEVVDTLVKDIKDEVKEATGQ